METELERMIKGVMSGLNLNVKTAQLILFISKGAQTLEVRVSSPLYLLIPGGTYSLMLEEVTWMDYNPPLRFEFVHLTFELKDHQISFLSSKIGLQEIQSGVTVRIAEERESEVTARASNGLNTALSLLELSREVRRRLMTFEDFILGKR